MAKIQSNDRFGINVQPSKTNNPYYYLMDGRRTTSPTHGLYIHNGQKIMIGK